MRTEEGKDFTLVLEHRIDMKENSFYYRLLHRQKNKAKCEKKYRAYLEKKKSKKGRNMPREEETQEMKMLERNEKATK